jgi:general secretion pathway protein C
MSAALRKYFWAVNLLVIAGCAYFLSSAVGNFVLAGIPMPKHKAHHSAIRSSAGGAHQRQRDVTSILARNVFCSKCAPAAELPTSDTPGPKDGKPVNPDDVDTTNAVKSSLNHRLIATLVSDDDKAFSYAAVVDPEDNRTRMFKIGQQLTGSANATIVDIMVRRILIHNAGRTEFIELDSGQPRARPTQTSPFRPKARRSRFSKFTNDIAAGIKKIGPNKWEIKRSALNKVLGNTHMLARSARIVPSVRNGKPNGFKLYAIRPGSLYSLIGMQNGDTIHAINGHAITTPDKALAVYTQVRTASHLTIAFSRRGRTTTHDYTIR